jgi:hypothetical protein
MKTDIDIDDLLNYATNHNDKYSDANKALIQLYYCRSMISDKLHDALIEEIEGNYNWYKENSYFVEETETITRTVKTLEFI